MAHSDAGRLHATATTWPGAIENAETDGDIRPLPDFSRVGLLLCFASAALTLIGIGSALERMFS